MNRSPREKLSRQARGFSPEELRDATVRLAELDHALKGRAGSRPTSSSSSRSSTCRAAGRGAARSQVALRARSDAGDELRACDFLRAAVFLWSAPRAAARSIVRTSSRCSAAIALGVAVGDRRLEALCERLDRRAVAEVLEPLARRDPDALLLLLDVRPYVKSARGCGRAMVAEHFRRENRPDDAAWRALRDPTARPRRASTRSAPDGAGSPARRRSSAPRPALSRVLGLVREMVAAYYFGAAGRDQRVHGRVPDPEPRAGARRRRRALGRVRPGLQRAAREGRAGARLARRVDDLLARLLVLGGLTALFILLAPLIVGRSATPAATPISRSASRASSSRS